MITYKNLQDFIQLHKKDLNKQSLIVILDKKTDIFKIYSHGGYLNIDSFQFKDSSGELIFNDLASNSGRVDSTTVASLWAYPRTCQIVPSVDVPNKSDLRSVEYNNVFDSFRDTFQTVETFEKSKRHLNGDAILTTCGVGPDFSLVSGIEILVKPKFIMTDSYGHKSPKDYKYNCVAIIVGEELTREFVPITPKITESLVIEKFADFIKKDS